MQYHEAAIPPRELLKKGSKFESDDGRDKEYGAILNMMNKEPPSDHTERILCHTLSLTHIPTGSRPAFTTSLGFQDFPPLPEPLTRPSRPKSGDMATEVKVRAQIMGVLDYRSP